MCPITFQPVLIGALAKNVFVRHTIKVHHIHREHFCISKMMFDHHQRNRSIDLNSRSRGEPTAQNYRNTDLTLSHVRINDEL